MVLKSKGFFLNLEEGASTDQVLQIAPVRDLPVKDDQEVSHAPIPAISKLVDGSRTVKFAKALRFGCCMSLTAHGTSADKVDRSGTVKFLIFRCENLPRADVRETVRNIKYVRAFSSRRLRRKTTLCKLQAETSMAS